MKKLMMTAAASTLLGGCAYYYPSGGDSLAQEGRYVPTGSNIPRKKGDGTAVVATMSAVELESARMDPGKAPELAPGQGF